MNLIDMKIDHFKSKSLLIFLNNIDFEVLDLVYTYDVSGSDYIFFKFRYDNFIFYSARKVDMTMYTSKDIINEFIDFEIKLFKNHLKSCVITNTFLYSYILNKICVENKVFLENEPFIDIYLEHIQNKYSNVLSAFMYLMKISGSEIIYEIDEAVSQAEMDSRSKFFY